MYARGTGIRTIWWTRSCDAPLTFVSHPYETDVVVDIPNRKGANNTLDVPLTRNPGVLFSTTLEGNPGLEERVWVQLIPRIAMDFTLRPWTDDDLDCLVRHANNENIARNLMDRFPHPYAKL